MAMQVRLRDYRVVILRSAGEKGSKGGQGGEIVAILSVLYCPVSAVCSCLGVGFLIEPEIERRQLRNRSRCGRRLLKVQLLREPHRLCAYTFPIRLGAPEALYRARYCQANRETLRAVHGGGQQYTGEHHVRSCALLLSEERLMEAIRMVEVDISKLPAAAVSAMQTGSQCKYASEHHASLLALFLARYHSL